METDNNSVTPEIINEITNDNEIKKETNIVILILIGFIICICSTFVGIGSSFNNKTVGITTGVILTSIILGYNALMFSLHPFALLQSIPASFISYIAFFILILSIKFSFDSNTTEIVSQN
jgi:hypothetical protein